MGVGRICWRSHKHLTRRCSELRARLRSSFWVFPFHPVAARHVFPGSRSLILCLVRANDYNDWRRLFVRYVAISISRVAKTNEHLLLRWLSPGQCSTRRGLGFFPKRRHCSLVWRAKTNQTRRQTQVIRQLLWHSDFLSGWRGFGMDRCNDLFNGSTRVAFSRCGNLDRWSFALDCGRCLTTRIPRRARSALTMRCSEPRFAPMRSFRIVSSSSLQSRALLGAVADLGSR